MSSSSSDCADCKTLQQEFEKNPGGKPMSKTGLALVALTGGAAALISAVAFPFVAPALRRVCLPFVPATPAQIENVLKALSSTSRSGRLVDIGSGDGRIVLAAADAGFQAHGIELNPWLVAYSKVKATVTRTPKATFARQDLFKTDFGVYDNVVIFGVEQMVS